MNDIVSNIFYFCENVAKTFIPTMAQAVTWFFTNTLNGLIADITEAVNFPVPEWLLDWLDVSGLGSEPIYLILVGGALFGVLAWNIVRWVVGIITGS